jgi:predicted nuclease of predicted toxin-antitoxin system
VKLLADPFFPEGVVQDLNEAGYDAVHALEIGAGDLPVREFLRLAAFEDRVVVTRNRSLARLVESDAAVSWPSVIFFRQDTVEIQVITSTLFNLLKLFNEDLKDGALLIVRDGQTLLRKFIKP